MQKPSHVLPGYVDGSAISFTAVKAFMISLTAVLIFVNTICRKIINQTDIKLISSSLLAVFSADRLLFVVYQL